MNAVYNNYFQKFHSLEEYYMGKWPAKLTGVIVASTFKEEIENIISKHQLKIKVSENNSYIIGQKTEFDFLLLKEDAEGINGLPIYRVEDVIAIIESKTNGVMDFDSDGWSTSLMLLSNSFNAVWKLNNNIRFGYMTMAERRPKTAKNRDSWENTCRCFNTYIENEAVSVTFAASLHHSYGKPYEYGTDKEWEDFVLTLVGKIN